MVQTPPRVKLTLSIEVYEITCTPRRCTSSHIASLSPARDPKQYIYIYIYISQAPNNAALLHGLINVPWAVRGVKARRAALSLILAVWRMMTVQHHPYHPPTIF
jgi:hypothetical protein